MHLSYHINFKPCPTKFKIAKASLRRAVNTISNIPLVRVEISKDNKYYENITVVIFLLEKKCITSLSGKGENMAVAIVELKKKISQYNRNQELVTAFMKRVEAA